MLRNPGTEESRATLRWGLTRCVSEAFAKAQSSSHSLRSPRLESTRSVAARSWLDTESRWLEGLSECAVFVAVALNGLGATVAADFVVGSVGACPPSKSAAAILAVALGCGGLAVLDETLGLSAGSQEQGQ
jgi:hypothetical protein